MPELHAEDSGLEGVESGVDPNLVMVILRLHPVDAQPGERPAEVGVIGGHQAAVAESAQVLGGVEAERRGLAEPAGATPLIRGPDGLGGVFENEEPVSAGDLVDRVHVGGLAVEVDRDDRPGPRRDGSNT